MDEATKTTLDFIRQLVTKKLDKPGGGDAGYSKRAVQVAEIFRNSDFSLGCQREEVRRLFSILLDGEKIPPFKPDAPKKGTLVMLDGTTVGIVREVIPEKTHVRLMYPDGVRTEWREVSRLQPVSTADVDRFFKRIAEQASEQRKTIIKNVLSYV